MMAFSLLILLSRHALLHLNYPHQSFNPIKIYLFQQVLKFMTFVKHLHRQKNLSCLNLIKSNFLVQGHINSKERKIYHHLVAHLQADYDHLLRVWLMLMLYMAFLLVDLELNEDLHSSGVLVVLPNVFFIHLFLSMLKLLIKFMLSLFIVKFIIYFFVFIFIFII